MYHFLIGQYLSPYSSGTGKFNFFLSNKLKIKIYSYKNIKIEKNKHYLISLKISEIINEKDETIFKKFIKNLNKNYSNYSIILHEILKKNQLEIFYLTKAFRIIALNQEIYDFLMRNKFKDVLKLYTPPQLLEKKKFNSKKINFFSFGMGHKINTKYYYKLKKIIIKSKIINYNIHISVGIHQGYQNLNLINNNLNKIRKIFGENFIFLGTVSDNLLYEYANKCDYFNVFFSNGLRENNSSFYTALSQKCLVITNLDKKSPKNFNHDKNLIDINKVNTLPNTKNKISNYKKKLLKNNFKIIKLMTWDNLISKL